MEKMILFLPKDWKGRDVICGWMKQEIFAYKDLWGFTESFPLLDPSLTKPSIQILNPKDRPYFFVRCNRKKPHLTFALMNSRQQIQYKAAEPGKKEVDFSLHSVRLKEAGSYTCQYHLESNPFVWSVPSNPLVFPLRGESPKQHISFSPFAHLRWTEFLEDLELGQNF